MTSEDTKLVVIDGSDALAAVLIRPGNTAETIALEAWAKGIDKPYAAHVLRHVADTWDPRIGRNAVLAAIVAERARQDEQWGEQNHPDGTGPEQEILPGWRAGDLATAARNACQHHASMGVVTWRDIFGEEVCEAFAETEPAKLRAELIQAAAVLVAWVQALDRRTDGLPALLQAVAEQLPRDDPGLAARSLAAMPGPADRAAVLTEAAEVAVRAARDCGDSEAGQCAASVAAAISKKLRRLAAEAQP